MQSELDLPKNRRLLAVAGLLAMAALQPVTADTPNGTYTWSAELVAVDARARTVTVQAGLVSDAQVDFDALDAGNRVTLTWSGINTAAGVRRIAARAVPASEQLTLPIEFVSAELDNRYVRFKVPVPTDDLERLSRLSPGQYITAESPRGAVRWEEAVADVRPYNDVQ
jgi:hypothetical protein